MIKQINLENKVKDLINLPLVYVGPNTLMSEIEQIFAENSFHHIPVLDDDMQPLGIISKSDYHKLQHHFTLFNYKDAEVSNKRFFRSLIAEDIMTKNPICIGSSTSLKEAVNMLLVNHFRSLLVVQNGKCVGVVTPYDFLELLMLEN